MFNTDTASATTAEATFMRNEHMEHDRLQNNSTYDKRRMVNKKDEPKQKKTARRVRYNSINGGKPNFSQASQIHSDVLQSQKRKQLCYSSNLLNILHHVPSSTNIKTGTVTEYHMNVYEWILYLYSTCLDFMNIVNAFLNTSDLNTLFIVCTVCYYSHLKQTLLQQICTTPRDNKPVPNFL